MAPARFWDRASPFTTEMFLQKTDIIATIKGFGLDVNRFWWAARLLTIGRLKSLPNVVGRDPDKIHL